MQVAGLHPNGCTLLTQHSISGLTVLPRHSVATYQGNELTHNFLSGNTQPQLPQVVEPLWTDPGVKSGISVLELILSLIHI